MSVLEPGAPSVVSFDLDGLERPVVTEVDGRMELLGSRCETCGTRAFPARFVCHRCGQDRPGIAAVGSRGRLYSWTTVWVSSGREVPYSLGYVDLDDDLRALCLLSGDPAAFRLDAPVALTVSGDKWSFAPEASAELAAGPSATDPYGVARSGTAPESRTDDDR